MMSKTLAMAVVLLGIVNAEDLAAAEPGAMSDSVKQQAELRAREKLAEYLKIATDAITVIGSEPRTWSDSSMGCGKPGTMALTVMTEGYAVALSAQGSEHHVHVSGNNAIVCDKARNRTARNAVNARGLDVMMERARQDLAQRLGVEPAQIRLAGMEPQRWNDSALGCPQQGESVQAGDVDGFKLSLQHSGRIYTYHTDRKTVRPCPPIETQ